MKPILSIAIPTYDRASYLEKTLECIAGQLTPEVEIAISDNASPDGTEAVVRSFQKRFAGQISYVKQVKNGGIDRNFLAVVELSRGDYCWMISDDDLIVPGAIARVLSEIKRSAGEAFIFLNYSRIDNVSGKVIRERMVEYGEDRLFTLNEFMGTRTRHSYFPFLGMHILYMSVFVFSRAAWLSHADRCRKSIGTNLLLCFEFVNILGTSRVPVKYVGTPLVRYRAGNARAWDNDVWKDFHTAFLDEARSAGVSATSILRMRLAYFPRRWAVKTGSIVKRGLQKLGLLPKRDPGTNKDD